MGAEGYTLGEAEDGVEGDLRLIMGSIRPVGGGGTETMVSSWRAVDRPDEDRIKSSQIAQAFRSFRAERAEVARVVNHLVPSHEVFPQPSFFVGGGGVRH